MAGWFGPNGDCMCACRFSAAFGYGDIAGGCLLAFAVSDLRSACSYLDYNTADITVELRRNGVLITDPLIPYTDSVGHTGGYWEEWKPTAGDEYRADITLNCGGNIITGWREYTIPTPANTNCNCCTERIPESVIISGLTGNATILNGTWAMESVGSCTYWAPSIDYGDPQPTNPCTGGLQLHSCSSGVFNFYYYRSRTRYPAVTLIMPTTTGVAVIEFSYVYNVWKYDTGTLLCSNTNSGSCASSSVAWRFEIDCNSGVATLISRTVGGGSPDTTLTDVIPDPTVTLVLP